MVSCSGLYSHKVRKVCMGPRVPGQEYKPTYLPNLLPSDVLLKLEMHQNSFRPRLCPALHWGAYDALSTPYSWLGREKPHPRSPPSQRTWLLDLVWFRRFRHIGTSLLPPSQCKFLAMPLHAVTLPTPCQKILGTSPIPCSGLPVGVSVHFMLHA